MKANFAKHVLVMLSVLILSSSCTQRSEDRSRSVDAYRQAGMPDPGRKWNLEDYTQAHNVLARLKWEYPYELPVKDSEKSGLLFNHMVSLEYLSFLQDSSLSLNAKAERISEFVRVYDYWTDAYATPMLRRSPYQREILEFRIFNLRLMEAMVNLMHQINQSDDPADAGLKYGHKYILGNYLTSIYADLKSQRSTPEFIKRDLERLADTIYASVMRNKEWMDSSTRNELNQSLNSVIDSTASDYIRNKYGKLQKTLMGTGKTASQF